MNHRVYKIYKDSEKKRARAILYYSKNKEKRLAQIRIYKHSPRGRETKRLWKIKNRQYGRVSYSPGVAFSKYKSGARKRNLEFNLDINYFKDNWNKNCSYCGDGVLGIGVDRIDSSKGYLLDNICICCRECNTMKRAMNKDYFINKCIKISENHIL